MIGRIVFYLIKSLICLSVHLPVPIIDLVVKEMAPAPEITLARSNQNKNCTGKVQLQRLFNIESRYEHTSIFMHFCYYVYYSSLVALCLRNTRAWNMQIIDQKFGLELGTQTLFGSSSREPQEPQHFIVRMYLNIYMNVVKHSCTSSSMHTRTYFPHRGRHEWRRVSQFFVPGRSIEIGGFLFT